MQGQDYIDARMSASSSRRGSALLNELSRAQAKIGSLEDFIRERERQLHVAVSRLHGGGDRSRRSSRFHARRRRAGITQDALLRMRTMSQESIEAPDDGMATILMHLLQASFPPLTPKTEKIKDQIKYDNLWA